MIQLGITGALAVCLFGCGVLEEYVHVQKPTAHVAGAHIQGFSLDSLTLLFDVEVGNPYSTPLPLVNLDYALSSRGAPFLTGRSDLSGSIPAMGSRNVSLPAKITFSSLLDTLANVRPGSVVPYAADLGVSVDAPILGRIRIPLRKEGEVPVPAVPEVSIAGVSWDQLALNEARGRITVDIANTNRFPLDLSKLQYALSLNGSPVANSAVEKPVTVAADGGEGSVEIPFSFAPIALGFGVFQALTSGEATFGLAGDLDVKTPYGPLSMPIRETRKLTFQR